MDSTLIASAAMLGLAGTPHCAAMCGAPCAALTGGGTLWASIGFHAARLASYAVGGAVVASSMGALAGLSQASPALRPVWSLLHALAFALGVWLLWQGRQPGWMGSFGRNARPEPAAAGTWQRVRGPLRATAGGSLWVAWPCGLLQSALIVAALTGTAAAGAGAMTAFGLTSSVGLLFAPWVWRRFMQGPQGVARERWVVRAAGLMLMVASGWALAHGIWDEVSAFCSTL